VVHCAHQQYMQKSLIQNCQWAGKVDLVYIYLLNKQQFIHKYIVKQKRNTMLLYTRIDNQMYTFLQQVIPTDIEHLFRMAKADYCILKTGRLNNKYSYKVQCISHINPKRKVRKLNLDNSNVKTCKTYPRVFSHWKRERSFRLSTAQLIVRRMSTLTIYLETMILELLSINLVFNFSSPPSEWSNTNASENGSRPHSCSKDPSC